MKHGKRLLREDARREQERLAVAERGPRPPKETLSWKPVGEAAAILAGLEPSDANYVLTLWWHRLDSHPEATLEGTLAHWRVIQAKRGGKR